MRIRFNAKTMPTYQGHDGAGGSLNMQAGDEAEVAETVAKLLKQKYGSNFDIVITERPAHAPVADKLYRKSGKTKTKGL